MKCTGNNPAHCCWLRGKVCFYLLQAPSSSRRWICSLRRELGSWEKVHSDRRYLAEVKPELEAMGLRVDCGDWPQNDPAAVDGVGLCCFEGVG